jgi:hypothetical protein
LLAARFPAAGKTAPAPSDCCLQSRKNKTLCFPTFRKEPEEWGTQFYLVRTTETVRQIDGACFFDG